MAETLGLFEQAVLLAIAAPVTSIGKEAYGRAVIKEVQYRLRKDITASAVYATLARLEEKRLISSRLGPGTKARAGRPRRFYRIEPAGVRALNESRAAVDRVWAGIRVPLKGVS
jgi:PadR family transcriptional regulator PadR